MLLVQGDGRAGVSRGRWAWPRRGCRRRARRDLVLQRGAAGHRGDGGVVVGGEGCCSPPATEVRRGGHPQRGRCAGGPRNHRLCWLRPRGVGTVAGPLRTLAHTRRTALTNRATTAVSASFGTAHRLSSLRSLRRTAVITPSTTVLRAKDRSAGAARYGRRPLSGSRGAWLRPGPTPTTSGCTTGHARSRCWSPLGSPPRARLCFCIWTARLPSPPTPAWRSSRTGSPAGFPHRCWSSRTARRGSAPPSTRSSVRPAGSGV